MEINKPMTTRNMLASTLTDYKKPVKLPKITVELDPELKVLVAGDASVVEPFARDHERAEALVTTEVIAMDEHPASAVRKKKDASIVRAASAVRAGQADGLFSAGSTGAVLTAATFGIGRIKGIRRAALAPVVPTGKGGSILIDAGATAECTPEYLLQFAFMGSYYAERILGRPEPRVGLLNIGAEPSKGMDLQREANSLLQKAGEQGRINFTGNVEPREAVYGEVDVIVADGYSGNIFLKTMEGVGGFLARELKAMFKKSMVTKLGALCVKDGLMSFKKLMDSGEVGGTALLGISKPVIKAHGSSNDYAIKNAIRQAAAFASSGIIEDIVENIDHMRLEKAPSSEGAQP